MNRYLHLIYIVVVIGLLATGAWFSWRIYAVTTNQPEPLRSVPEYISDTYADEQQISSAIQRVTGQSSDQFVTDGPRSDDSFTAIDTHRLNQVIVVVNKPGDDIRAVSVSCPDADELLAGYDCRRPGALEG